MNDKRDPLSNRVVAELPPLNARFHVPRLVDKPQNPILDTLKLSGDLDVSPVHPTLLLRQEVANRGTNKPVFNPIYTGDTESLWQKAVDEGSFHGVLCSLQKHSSVLTSLPG